MKRSFLIMAVCLFFGVNCSATTGSEKLSILEYESQLYSAVKHAVSLGGLVEDSRFDANASIGDIHDDGLDRLIFKLLFFANERLKECQNSKGYNRGYTIDELCKTHKEHTLSTVEILIRKGLDTKKSGAFFISPAHCVRFYKCNSKTKHEKLFYSKILVLLRNSESLIKS